MKGLLLKDLLNLKKSIKLMLIIGIAYSIFFSTFEPTTLTGLLTLLFAMQSLSSFSYDEFSKWDCYALSMPLSKKDLVLSKYFLFIGFPIIGSFLSIIITITVSLIKNNLNMLDILSGSMGYLFSIEVLMLILLPFVFKFGIERGRLIITLISFGSFGILFLAAKLIQQFNIPLPSLEIIYDLTPIIPFIAIALIAIIAFISYQASTRIVDKKEY